MAMKLGFSYVTSGLLPVSSCERERSKVLGVLKQVRILSNRNGKEIHVIPEVGRYTTCGAQCPQRGVDSTSNGRFKSRCSIKYDTHLNLFTGSMHPGVLEYDLWMLSDSRVSVMTLPSY